MLVIYFSAHLLHIRTHLSVSSLQLLSVSTSESIFTPVSCGMLCVKSSSIKWAVFDLKAEAKEAQPFSPILQLKSLQPQERKEKSQINNFCCFFYTVIWLIVEQMGTSF